VLKLYRFRNGVTLIIIFDLLPWLLNYLFDLSQEFHIKII
jgi:hypothetical protein